MGDIKDSLICGYYDETMNYIVELDSKILLESVPTEYKDFLTNIETKIKLYDYIKNQMIKELDPKCNEFVIELR